MARKKYVIFTAGGSGTRMGAGVPKQFLTLEGIPVLQRSISVFLNACPDVKVVTVLPKEHFAEWKELCQKNSFEVPQLLAEGGISRFHSVKAALERVPDGAIVAIHDGVRPLVSEGLVRTMFEKMETLHALIPVIPVTDTLKTLERASDGTLRTSSSPDPDRGRTFAAQTPQMFLSEEIRAAYTLPYNTAFTDDASVARKYGIPLSYIIGERHNLKLTVPEDMEEARRILFSGRLCR